jgi:hypothetical protein
VIKAKGRDSLTKLMFIGDPEVSGSANNIF